MLPKTSPSVKSYDGKTKWMNFSIDDDKFWGKYTIKTNLEPAYYKKLLKTKIKYSYHDEATDFHNNDSQ